jgi:hypothetical protein
MLVLAVLLVPGSAWATYPGQNGKINAMEYGWITQHDGCSTDTAQLGQTLFTSSLGSPAKINLSDPNNGWAVEVGHLTWSPDGQRYLFGASRFDELGIANADGTSVFGAPYGYYLSTYSPTYSTGVSSVAWKPDSLSFIFATGVSLFSMNMDGSDMKFISWGDFANLSWAPDGSKLAFQRNNQIGTVRPDGSNSMLFPAGVEGSYDRQPDWSPNSQKLVFSSNRAQLGTNQWDQPDQIFTMNTNGTGRIQLTNNYTYRYTNPTWSPDGTKILVNREKFTTPANTALVILNAQSGAQEGIYIPPCNVAFSSTGWQPVTSPFIYRLANWKTHERLFTTSPLEALAAPRNDSGWIYEGVGFRASQNGAGTTPVYRLANWITKERLFTTSATERDYALAHYAGWVNEGTAFHSINCSGGTTSIYRLANWKTHERLFTPSSTEADNAVNNLEGWVNEGVAFCTPAQ